MSIIGDIAKFAGGVVGNSVLPGLGGPIGSALGGELGGLAEGIAGQALKQFEHNPVACLLNPQTALSQFVDNNLKQLGVPAPFRNIVKFAQNPGQAILDQIANPAPTQPTVSTSGQTANDGLVTNGKNVVDTGRYLITASHDELKIYDKQTGTFVKEWGDPHSTTSAGHS